MRAPALLGGWLVVLVAPLLAAAAEPDGVAFFEQKIRPVLVKECYSCHSAGAKAPKGGLRLDSRAGVLEGGDTGPAVVPGKPEESLLLEALRHDGLVMPPKNRLTDPVIADFERWVAMGAPDPRVDVPGASKRQVGMDLESGRTFWSYRSPVRHVPPRVADAGWPITNVDRFILARQEAQGLRPVADADSETLVRRLYYDLAGLPPTLEEVDAFVGDPSPSAYEALVDRLLASPHFGERWGRHWLDVVRFAESLTLRGFVFKEAWRYRDYVIDAFNADLPYDRFLREQVAGDLLPASGLAERRRQFVGVTFLTLGNTNLEEQDKPQLVMDLVDEQVDTIGKAFLGQTIGCARCHDHKFDPIPTRDYYALAGILRNTKALEHANVSKWVERPLPVAAGEEALREERETAVAALEARIKALRGKTGAQAKGKAKRGAIAVSDLPGIVIDDTQARKVGEWQPSRFNPHYVGEGYVHDLGTGKGEKTLTFQPEIPEAGPYEVWLAYAAGSNRSKAVPVVILSAAGEKTVEVDMTETPPIEDQFVSLGRYPFERNGQGYVLISNEGTSGHVIADAVVFIPAKQADARAAVGAGSSPAAGKNGATADREVLRAMQADLERLRASVPKRAMVMSVEEPAKVEPMRVHVRGSVHTLGEPAPRGFLRVASFGEPPTFPSHESGRRELAEWLADTRNPLTARVLVNRAWHWLFGAGIVRSTDNFGTTGDAPTHPELLDELAVRFMEEGWSLKRLVRRLVLSRTYRLAAVDDPRARTVDPENRLHWRANRRRLDAECIRDAILAVGGGLDLAIGGPSFPPDLAADYDYKDDASRRSVYLPVFRNALPELFEVFDFADPSMVVGSRNVSTVAPQALFLLNHPFVLDQSRAAARRLLAAPAEDGGARIVRAYRQVLGRPPTAAERRIARAFLAEGAGARPPAAPEDSWALLYQALFASADFLDLR